MHPQEMPQFAELGLLKPLDDIVAQSDVINAENYLASAWDPNVYLGALYGIPLDLHMHGLYYNVDLFEEAGIEGPPATGDELLEAARLLTVDAKGLHPGDEGFDPETVEQYGINMHTNHHAFFQWWSLLNQLGGTILSEDGSACAIDIDKGTQAWQWLQDLVYEHGVAPQGQTDYPRDFLSGRTAMLIDGPWRMPALETAQEETGFNWASAPYPVVFDEPAVWGSAHIFTLPAFADPDKEAEAVAFLEWLAANSSAWANAGQLPAFAAVMESAEFQSMPGRAAFIEMMPYEKIFPNTPKYSEIFASNAPTPMMVMAQNIMLEQGDPRAAVETACTGIDAILAIP
jgi:multiple sugar transport system substrate-binding protein